MPNGGSWRIHRGRRRKETLDALIAFISVRLGKSGPHLVVLEDIHWADPSTMALLKALVERCTAGWNALILATHAPIRGRPVRASVTRAALAAAWGGGRQAVGESAGAARHVKGRHQSNESNAQTGCRCSAEELVRFARTTASSSAAGRWAEPGDVPLTLRGALAAQLEGLGKAKQVAQLGAVIGRSFQSDVLEAVLDEVERPGAATALTRPRG